MVFSSSFFSHSSSRILRTVAASTVFTAATTASAPRDYNNNNNEKTIPHRPVNSVHLSSASLTASLTQPASFSSTPSARRSSPNYTGESNSSGAPLHNTSADSSPSSSTDMSGDEHDHGFHIWDRPIRRVAIIGSGPSGTPAARHCLEAGLEVKVFERQAQPGGIWNWSPHSTAPLSIPTPPPSLAAFTPVARGRQGTRVYRDAPGLEDGGAGSGTEAGGSDWERFNPANPVYWTLTNNVPTTTMAFKDFPYPTGTSQNISHALIASYVRAYAAHFGIDQVTSYNTRVETVDKVQVGSKESWRLRLRKLEMLADGHLSETIWEELFDAVVVATGHYNAPKIPPIPGVSAWSTAFPGKLIHSQGYRTPHQYAGKNVMIVGIGTSGADIARDLAPHVNKLYMVGREIKRDVPQGYAAMRRMQRFTLPSNAEQVREIDHFVDPALTSVQPQPQAHAQAPGVVDAGDVGEIKKGRVVLKDGRVLSGIDHVIFATGYQYSYPFLSQLHIDPSTPAPSGFSFPLVTDGTSVQHLYRDVFYLPDPTLAFVGLSINTSAFSFFEYQSLSIARVWARTAALPNFPRRWGWYERKLAQTGGGVWMHFMGREGERAYVRETVEWLNRDSQWSGAPLVEGHSEEWLRESDLTTSRIAKKYGLTDEQWRAIATGDDGAAGGPGSQGQQGAAREAGSAREETARKVRAALMSRAREA